MLFEPLSRGERTVTHQHRAGTLRAMSSRSKRAQPASSHCDELLEQTIAANYKDPAGFFRRARDVMKRFRANEASTEGNGDQEMQGMIVFRKNVPVEPKQCFPRKKTSFLTQLIFNILAEESIDPLLPESPGNQQARVRHSTMVEPLLRYELNVQLCSFEVVRSYRVTWKMKRCTNRPSCFVSIFKVFAHRVFYSSNWFCVSLRCSCTLQCLMLSSFILCLL